MGFIAGYRTQAQWIIRLLLLYFTFAAYAQAEQTDQQKELDNLRKRISKVQVELEQIGATKSEASDALRESERAISNINRKLSNLAAKLRSTDHELNTLESKQKQLSTVITGQQVLLGKLLHQQYLGGKQEYLKLLLNNQDPNRIARELNYYQYIARKRASWLDNLRADYASLKSTSLAVQAHRSELTRFEDEQSAQRNLLAKQKSTQKNTFIKLSKQLRQQRREMSRLQRNENSLAQLVEKISEMLDQPKSNSLFRNDNLPDNRFDGEPFAQLKGKLTLPVKGDITNRFGTPRPDSTLLWKGLFLKTPSGQSVKSIAAGRVVFADWLRGFGNLLIVDHGKGYMSLYGYNETLNNQVGDLVHGGDTIAITGNSGGNDISGLYFELRHKSKPLDPLRWLAINQR